MDDLMHYRPRGIVHQVIHSTKGAIVFTVAQKRFVVLVVHLFVSCTHVGLFLPPGIRGWLRQILKKSPRCFILQELLDGIVYISDRKHVTGQ